jgi:hypothetical protein
MHNAHLITIREDRLKGKWRRKRETEKDCNLCKQQVFIRERRPERDPRPSEQHSERGERMPVLQAGVFRHPIVGTGRLEKKWLQRGNWGKVRDIIRKVVGSGQPAIHTVFLCPFIGDSHICFVSVFLNIICVCVWEREDVASLLSTSCWPGTMWGIVEPGEFVEAWWL